jgi:hypothetical protein
MPTMTARMPPRLVEEENPIGDECQPYESTANDDR